MFYQLLQAQGNSLPSVETLNHNQRSTSTHDIITMFYPLTPAGLEVAEADPSGTVGTMVVCPAKRQMCVALPSTCTIIN